MSNATIFTLILLTLFLTSNSCKDDDQNPNPTVINEVTGTVKDENNNPYANTLVKLFNGSTTLETRTNAAGNFSYDLQRTGDFQITIIPPLATKVTSQDTVSVNVQKDVEANINFTIQSPSLSPNVILGPVDIFGEVRDQNSMIPTSPDEPLYARNVFDPPIGQLTPIKRPSSQHVILSEWKNAQGTIKVNCTGNATTVNLALQHMIPNGTYTIWLDFLNKVKKVGELVNLNTDLVTIEPLGSGTLNVVRAGSDGSINTSINHSSCVLTREVALVMIVDYHINGNTFGSGHIPDAEDVSHLIVYFQ